MTVGISYRSFYSNTSGLSTYTFSTCDIGTASSDRIVFVSFMTRGSSTTAPTVTIGGTSATVLQANVFSSYFDMVGFAYLAVPSGTTATVVLTFPASQLRCGIATYAVTGASGTLKDNQSATAATGTSASVTINTAAGGGAIACFEYYNNDTPTWTGGLTQDYATAISVLECTGASATGLSAGTLSPTCSPTSSQNGLAMYCVSISPSGGGGGSPLFRRPLLNGLGAGGPFFSNPLGRSMLGWVPGLIIPRRRLVLA